MSIKIHYLFCQLDRFPENLGDLSEEHEERFHQDFKTMQERYQDRWIDQKMANCCWSMLCDCPTVSIHENCANVDFVLNETRPTINLVTPQDFRSILWID